MLRHISSFFCIAPCKTIARSKCRGLTSKHVLQQVFRPHRRFQRITVSLNPIERLTALRSQPKKQATRPAPRRSAHPPPPFRTPQSLVYRQTHRCGLVCHVRCLGGLEFKSQATGTFVRGTFQARSGINFEPGCYSHAPPSTDYSNARRSSLVRHQALGSRRQSYGDVGARQVRLM